MMGTAINLFICFVTASATIAVLFFETYLRRRFERWSSDYSRQALERILDAVSQLSTLPPEERGPVRRAIARDILLDIEVIYVLVSECYRHDQPENQEVDDLAVAVIIEIPKLIWEVRKSLFIFYFHPNAVANCERIFRALEHHYRIWEAYIQFLQAKYPELREIPMDDAP